MMTCSTSCTTVSSLRHRCAKHAQQDGIYVKSLAWESIHFTRALAESRIASSEHGA